MHWDMKAGQQSHQHNKHKDPRQQKSVPRLWSRAAGPRFPLLPLLLLLLLLPRRAAAFGATATASRLSPQKGPLEGGLQLTVYGSNFQRGAALWCESPGRLQMPVLLYKCHYRLEGLAKPYGH